MVAEKHVAEESLDITRIQMRCAVSRWGPGTTCERPTNTAASKELQDRLKQMQAERASQDKMWDTEPTQTTQQQQVLIKNTSTK
jgi:hypothetical protein